MNNPRCLYDKIIVAACFAAVPAIGYIDYLTGPDIAFSLFYLIPIVALALKGRRSATIALSFFACFSWFYADYLLHDESYLRIEIWNTLTRLTTFLSIGYLLLKTRDSNKRISSINKELSRLLALEQELSRTDHLTKLPNSRAFLEALARELNRKHRNNDISIALAYIDLDNFKKVNDTYGHSRGDTLLQECASIMVSSIRSGDIAGRLGGDEFAILIIGADQKDVANILQRIKTGVDDLASQFPGLGFSATFGAAFANQQEDATCLMRRADQIMYKAKHQGKSRFIIDAQ